MRLAQWWLPCALAIAGAPAVCAADDSEIVVHVEQRGRTIVVDVSMPVEATPVEAWQVMTDYDHMAKFVSNLDESKVLSRTGDTLTVFQKGTATRGPLTFSFENVREIVLTPYREIRSRMISGDLESSQFTTRVVEADGATRITNHGEFVPKIWVPPVIGPSLIAAETRRQFGQLRAEILRRKALSVAPRPPA
ncbi:MAG: SRPBCC family protein [Betaproteobacteria bacterium]